jgi:hypothetical protein
MLTIPMQYNDAPPNDAQHNYAKNYYAQHYNTRKYVLQCQVSFVLLLC